MTEKIKQYDEEGRVIRENRSQIKRERAIIRQFAQDLSKLPQNTINRLPIDETLQQALVEAKRLSQTALKRHLTYLTRLIEAQDYELIKNAYNQLDNQKNSRLIDQLIDDLIANNNQSYQSLNQISSEIDKQLINNLLRQINKHPENPKYKQKLRKYLLSFE